MAIIDIAATVSAESSCRGRMIQYRAIQLKGSAITIINLSGVFILNNDLQGIIIIVAT